MDAASNNSVDNIRRICDEVQFLPTLARYKVYIVDEVHMLSPGAFNALLKTLEEPPAHAVFILATTDPHRIPPTIVSRCQRYDFHRIPVAGIVGRLREISDANGILVTDDALEAVATLADGALRDAISLLDQCRATFTEEITRDDVLSLAGVVNDTFMYDMGCAMADRDAARAMELTDAMILDGRDVVRFTSDLAAYYRDVMMCQVSTRPDALVRASSEAIRGMRALAGRYRLETLLAIVRDLSELLSNLRWAPDPRTLFEITLIRIMQTARTESDGTPPPGKIRIRRPIPCNPRYNRCGDSGATSRCDRGAHPGPNQTSPFCAFHPGSRSGAGRGGDGKSRTSRDKRSPGSMGGRLVRSLPGPVGYDTGGGRVRHRGSPGSIGSRSLAGSGSLNSFPGTQA